MAFHGGPWENPAAFGLETYLPLVACVPVIPLEVAQAASLEAAVAESALEQNQGSYSVEKVALAASLVMEQTDPSLAAAAAAEIASLVNQSASSVVTP